MDQLNERLNCFDYGYYNDRNKPSPIIHLTMKSDNNSLKQKGLYLRKRKCTAMFGELKSCCVSLRLKVKSLHATACNESSHKRS